MTLTAAGWSFLVVAWLAIGALTTWCMARVLRSRTTPGADPGERER